ncbi:unnamed protein product [Amoebophrya sp. A25]|nr:unnamed protein product [Amoebophrya sp. A25]|eukprot:GSA25T00015101001.1
MVSKRGENNNGEGRHQSVNESPLLAIENPETRTTVFGEFSTQQDDAGRLRMTPKLPLLTDSSNSIAMLENYFRFGFRLQYEKQRHSGEASWYEQSILSGSFRLRRHQLPLQRSRAPRIHRQPSLLPRKKDF